MNLTALLAPMIFFAWAIAVPKLEHRPDNTKAPFEITHQEGAIWACTVYQSETETIDEIRGGRVVKVPYTPRHCWGLDESSTSYEDDWAYIKKNDGYWKVWAEVYYIVDDRIPEPVVVETNVVRVRW